MDTPTEFQLGSSVIYAMHGKCSVIGVEVREMGGTSMRFYRLEVQKSALSRSTRQEPAIWVPAESARAKGLRSPMDRSQAEAVLALLADREYYFSLHENWGIVQPKLEAMIRSEGGLGLAKVMSYLYVLRKKQIVPMTEVNRMYETVLKLLLRELSEALGVLPRVLDQQIQKSIRQKLTPDT